MHAGNWVLIDGIDATITKSATVTDASEEQLEEEQVGIFLSIAKAMRTSAVVKLALNPAEPPKMLDGLRKINKSFSQSAHTSSREW
jgi:116 kDa U5 small nuclear ribonucleoprotein component